MTGRARDLAGTLRASAPADPLMQMAWVDCLICHKRAGGLVPVAAPALAEGTR